MNDYNKNNDLNYQELLDKVNVLEKRLIKVESLLKLEWVGQKSKSIQNKIEEPTDSETTETKIIEYGLSWLGSIVFSFGIIFLMTYVESLGYIILSRIIAYTISFILLVFSLSKSDSLPILTNVLKVCSVFVLFYLTLSLHFFSDQALIQNVSLALALLLLIIVPVFIYSIRSNREHFALIGILLCFITAIVSNTTYITLSFATVIALISLYFFFTKVWWKLQIFSLFLTYIIHLVWLLGNPFMNSDIGLVEEAQYNLVYLISYVTIFSASIFITKSKLESNGILVTLTVWNAICFSLILLIILPSFYGSYYSFTFNAIAIICIVYAILLKTKSSREFAPAVYACFGFVAISLSIYTTYGLPDAYFLLVLQSFMVVSMALWFKSRIIVIANVFLFLIILVLYLLTSESINNINIAFALTALATARIINWKKERLVIKTELFRNIYLGLAFLMILYSLNMVMPPHFVAIAWTISAFIFFVLSVLLKNIKYRYMSIATILVTGVHILFVDLSQMDVGYRVIAFIVFAIISLSVSFYYSKRLRNK